jgi:hypothetical protein
VIRIPNMACLLPMPYGDEEGSERRKKLKSETSISLSVLSDVSAVAKLVFCDSVWIVDLSPSNRAAVYKLSLTEIIVRTKYDEIFGSVYTYRRHVDVLFNIAFYLIGLQITSCSDFQPF